MTSYLLLEDGDRLLLEDGAFLALEDHTGASSGTGIAVVDSTYIASVLVQSTFYRDDEMVQSLKSIQDENRMINIGTFKEWRDDLQDHVLFDPTDGVFVILRNPNGTETTYQVGVNPEATQDSVGTYRLIFDATIEGHYHCRWYCTGTEMGSHENRLRVELIQTTNT